MTLSIVMITKNSEEMVGEALESVKGLWSELLVGDMGSNDKTVEIVRRYGGRVIQQSGDNLGERKQELVIQAKGDWVLVLDTDERISPDLWQEIKKVLKDGICHAYRIPYQNYVFGKPVYYGGENYSKTRLFKNGYGKVLVTPLHEEIETKGVVGELKGKIDHYSYRSLGQLFRKFTEYAKITAFLEKFGIRNDKIKKLFFYGPHMFWARYIKEQGYRDGWRGFVLAFAFAYMESLTYWFMLL